jgi:hypothetical protein
MDSSSDDWENYWQIPPPLSPLLLILGFSETRPAQQRTPHLSTPAHTPTCCTKKLDSKPPELAGDQPAATEPRDPRPAGQRLGPRLCGRGAPGVPISHGGALQPPEQGAVTSIGLAAGASIVQAPGLPSAPVQDACRAALQSGSGHGPQFVAASPGRAGSRRFNRAQTHVPDTGHNSRCGRLRPAHAAEPPCLLHLSLAPSSRSAGKIAR